MIDEWIWWIWSLPTNQSVCLTNGTGWVQWAKGDKSTRGLCRAGVLCHQLPCFQLSCLLPNMLIQLTWLVFYLFIYCFISGSDEFEIRFHRLLECSGFCIGKDFASYLMTSIMNLSSKWLRVFLVIFEILRLNLQLLRPPVTKKKEPCAMFTREIAGV